jgi:hypothetical protein
MSDDARIALAATEALYAADVLPEYLNGYKALLLRSLRQNHDGRVYVVDGNDRPRYGQNGLMCPDERAAELRAQAPSAFRRRSPPR